ncbi:MAG: hypothetical protein II951_13660 [Bacteroidales bacterium]|nr:hypothetical protein [Bacteroidales bacterium]
MRRMIVLATLAIASVAVGCSDDEKEYGLEESAAKIESCRPTVGNVTVESTGFATYRFTCEPEIQEESIIDYNRPEMRCRVVVGCTDGVGLTEGVERETYTLLPGETYYVRGVCEYSLWLGEVQDENGENEYRMESARRIVMGDVTEFKVPGFTWDYTKCETGNVEARFAGEQAYIRLGEPGFYMEDNKEQRIPYGAENADARHISLLVGDFENEEAHVGKYGEGKDCIYRPEECRIDLSDVTPILKYRFALRVSPSVYEGKWQGESYYYSKVLTCRVVNM